MALEELIEETEPETEETTPETPVEASAVEEAADREPKAEEPVAEESAVEEAQAEESAAEEPAAKEAAPEEPAQAEEPAAKEAAPEESATAEEPAARQPAESMEDMGSALEDSYKNMGDGVHDTDALIAWSKIGEMKEAGTTLELEITGVVNKGVIVPIEGIRGFIPASRLSLRRVDDLNEWLGKTVKARILTADKDADKLVLSCTEILKEERDNAKKEKIAAVNVGEVFDGTVDSVQDYGVFVDIGNGLSGLVHISQISLDHIKHPSDVLKVGDAVRVKVIGKQDGKLKLSIKALQEQKKKEEETRVELPKAESVGTSLGDILKNVKL